MPVETSGPVVCYGVLGIDQIVQVEDIPGPDGHTRILADETTLGGEATHTAVTLGALGARVRLMGNTLGDDRFGHLFVQWIRSHPVDASRIDVSEGVETGHALILSDRNGGRRSCGHFPDLRSRPLSRADLEGAALLSVGPFLGKNAVLAARLARDLGVPIFSVEVSERHALAECCDVVVNSGGFLRRHRMGSPADVAIGLLKAGVETVVITRGAEGCLVYREDGGHFEVPIYRVPVCDTTGAGDAFRAGLIYSYLKGWTLTRGVQFSSACAALTCAGLGGSGHVDGEGQVHRLMGQS